MDYEARAMGFECPSWNAAEMAVDAGGDTDKDVGADFGLRASEEAMVEEVLLLEGSEVGDDGY
ncbi:hypothetical protein Hanom_Chr09g00781431 [Helianthus anomalus]